VRGIEASAPNAVAVHIESIEFLGPFCRARLRPEVEAGELVADFSTNLMRDLKVAAGQRITVALPPESLRVFVDGKA
jgi:iron(III) transport system ATP-binding protein